MADIITIDKSGRIVIPKPIRDVMNIKEGTKFLISAGEHGRIELQKFEIDDIIARIEIETKGVDFDAIEKKVRKEMDEWLRENYPDLYD
ncbi:MAG: AbrB/MazE/SpoVT family DNA-binding domain-containing protein [Thermoplasmata archaeon]